MLCSKAKSFELAYDESSAVFLGELVEIKPVIIDTTHHGKKEYFTGKFMIVSSWKLVDKEFVNVSLPGKKSACAEFAERSNYLVFANQMGSQLHITADSRTSLAGTDIAFGDLQQLGETKLVVRSGEFTLGRDPFNDIVIALLLLLVLGSGIYFWIKKLQATDLSKFKIAVPFLMILLTGCFGVSQQNRLIGASAYGNVDDVRRILESKNVDINSTREGGPAISVAAYYGHADIVALFIEHQADINFRDINGFTPLMNAVLGGQPEVVRLLLEKGADHTAVVQAYDGKGPIAAIDIAKMKKNEEIVSLLQKFSGPTAN